MQKSSAFSSDLGKAMGELHSYILYYTFQKKTVKRKSEIEKKAERSTGEREKLLRLCSAIFCISTISHKRFLSQAAENEFVKKMTVHAPDRSNGRR